MPGDQLPETRRQYRLGLLTLVAEATVPVARLARWLPRTGKTGEDRSVAALWVGGSSAHEAVAGETRLIAGSVALRMDERTEHAQLLSPSARADLDLEERWGRVSPRDATGDLGPILTASAAMLLGRGGAVFLGASAIVDRSGGGWMIVGSQKDRSWLTRAFVDDGCEFVSDDQLVARRSSHQPGTMLVESWHRASMSADGKALPADRWVPLAQLRGVLLAREISSRTPLAWRPASRGEALASLSDAAPHLLSDTAMTDRLHGILAECAGMEALTALLTREADDVRGLALRQLDKALDGIR